MGRVWFLERGRGRPVWGRMRGQGSQTGVTARRFVAPARLPRPFQASRRAAACTTGRDGLPR